jgi:hypothetical protein
MNIAGMRKWLSRQAHNLKVVGSNPTPALSPYNHEPSYNDESMMKDARVKKV